VSIDEHLVVPVSENGIGNEDTPEKEDFGQKEKPHSQFCGIDLLFEIREVVG